MPVVESKRRALQVLEQGSTYALVTLVYSRSDLPCSPCNAPIYPCGMHYERSPWVPCFLKLSCVRCTPSQLRAGRDSVLVQLIIGEGAQVLCISQASFLFGSTRSINLERLLALLPRSIVTAPLESTCNSYLFIFLSQARSQA